VKIGSDIYIDAYSQDVEDVPSGNKTGGIQLDIEGKINQFVGHDGCCRVHLWLSRKECKALRKLIRERE